MGSGPAAPIHSNDRRPERGRERDTGARISKALGGQSRAAGHKPLTPALRFRQSLTPNQEDLTPALDFHPSPGADSWIEGEAQVARGCRYPASSIETRDESIAMARSAPRQA